MAPRSSDEEQEDEVAVPDGLDEYEQDDGDGDGAPPATTGTVRPSMTVRLSQTFAKFTQPGGARDGAAADAATPTMSEAEKAKTIRRIDQTERRIGFFGTGLLAVIGLVAFVPYIENPKKRVSETISRLGKHCPAGYKAIVVNGAHQCTRSVPHSAAYWAFYLCIVLAFAAFILIATLVGKRSLLAFALLFGGLAVNGTTGSIIGLIFVVAGGWLLVRAYRVQKHGTTSGKEVALLNAERRAERKSGASSKSASPGTTTGRSAKGTKGTKQATTSAKATKGADAGDGRQRPPPNKRYTPKAPPRKKVPPAE
jgi:hypothetical protein